jgi:hypothetical protein
MRIGPGFVIYDSTSSLFWTLLGLGACLVASALLCNLVMKFVPRLSAAMGGTAFVIGCLASIDFIVGGSWWRVYPHRLVYEELVLAVACYILTADALPGPPRWIVLASTWAALVVAAHDQMRYWGGFGTYCVLDAAMLGAIVLPVALGFAGWRGSNRGRRRSPPMDGVLEMSVRWPAWIRFKNEAALVTVTDHAEWNADSDLHAWPYDSEDRLVDSTGQEFAFDFSGEPGKGKAVLVPTGTRLGADGIREVLRRHFDPSDKQSPGFLRRLETAADDEVAHVAAALLEEQRLGK